jgi:hypothetical protein
VIGGLDSAWGNMVLAPWALPSTALAAIALPVGIALIAWAHHRRSDDRGLAERMGRWVGALLVAIGVLAALAAFAGTMFVRTYYNRPAPGEGPSGCLTSAST